ncbi:MAG TPA: hypothetical protein DEA43_03160 [Candidatus Moranbacteria bacterium]|nr:hypothetical protein [Candidatus Moranbacteria bacterium]HBI33784.1 hypothetical protein [Candidatus Moranbacteria bacterium]HBT45853.1 hypothetical protein [Candidatus Moranbacteria bacterium]
MDSKIKNILERMDSLNESLRKEYARLSKKYGFLIKQKRIVFSARIRKRNRKFRIPAWKYVIPKSILHLLAMPFIYMMIVPAVILDVFITVYHWAVFPLCGIPKVKRNEYIIYDRRFLDYLNVIQKVHCLYCSYVNGLFAYCLEISARTERYWCPIKAAQKPNGYHNWYKDFADYGSPEEWNRKFNDQKAFEEFKKHP